MVLHLGKHIFGHATMRYSAVEPQVWMWLMLICAISSHIAIGILQIVRCISLTSLFVCVTWRLMILYNIPQLLMQHVLFMDNHADGQTMSVIECQPYSEQK